MKIRISYKVAILLGLMGWLLNAYPRAFLFYQQFSSGEMARVAYRALARGTVDDYTAMFGLSLLPVAPLIFLAAMYLEAAGIASGSSRRIAAGVAAILMGVSIAASAAVFLRGAGWLDRALAGLAAIQLLSWALFMASLAAPRGPFRDRAAAATAGSIALLTAFLACVVVAEGALRMGLRRTYSLSLALYLAASACIVVFALSAKGEAAAARP